MSKHLEDMKKHLDGLEDGIKKHLEDCRAAHAKMEDEAKKHLEACHEARKKMEDEDDKEPQDVKAPVEKEEDSKQPEAKLEAPVDERLSWTYQDWVDKDWKGLKLMRSENIEKYNQLFKPLMDQFTEQNKANGEWKLEGKPVKQADPNSTLFA